MLFKGLSNPKVWIFMLSGINKTISHWQNVLVVMVHILINKDVFEPNLMV